MLLEIREEYDGRLPIFNVVAVDMINKNVIKLLKSFASYQEAEKFYWAALKEDGVLPCGEENPC